MFSYYLLIECRHCDEEIYYGLCATTLEHLGRPVVPFDTASQTTFDCPSCNARNHVNDIDDVVEVEDGDDEDEDLDEEEEDDD